MSKVPIVSAVMVNDDPRSGKVFLLIVHQALLFNEIKHSFLCPLPLRLNDVVTDERPSS
jgi:hypothetical protein